MIKSSCATPEKRGTSRIPFDDRASSRMPIDSIASEKSCSHEGRLRNTERPMIAINRRALLTTLAAAGLIAAALLRRYPACCRRGVTARGNLSLTSSAASHARAAPTMWRRPSASPRSTTTARCGARSHCRCRAPSPSTVSRRWRRSTRNGRTSSRLRRCSRATPKRSHCGLGAPRSQADFFNEIGSKADVTSHCARSVPVEAGR